MALSCGRWAFIILFNNVFWLVVLSYLMSHTGRSKHREACEELNDMDSQYKEQLQSKCENFYGNLIKEHNETLLLLSAAEKSGAKCLDLVAQLKEKTNTDCLLMVAQLQETISNNSAPRLKYEEVRRRLQNSAQELWYYLKAQLRKVNAAEVPKILRDVGNHHRNIMVDLESLSDLDNYKDWREKEHNSLQRLMQRRLHHVQNPRDCLLAKKMVYNLHSLECGFGCQLHHLVHGLMMAYSTERTLVQQSKGWSYMADGWESVFLPLSEKCTHVPEKQAAWQDEKTSAMEEVVLVKGLTTPNPPKSVPLSIPEDLAPRLRLLYGDPQAWFIGQFVMFLLQPQPHLHIDLEAYKSTIGFIHPIVGIQIRRTDKLIWEARAYPLESYMEDVEEWFLKYEIKQGKALQRRVYLATDDPSVLPEARQKYPSYLFIADASVVESAGVSSRFSEQSLRGVVRDVELLAQCDFVVCTFSSNMCRLVYELMQTVRPDASLSVRSLDEVFTYAHRMINEDIAIYSHKSNSSDEIDLEQGDVIYVEHNKNHWDGYSEGKNMRTGMSGLYPSYKTKRNLLIVEYPTYTQV